MTKILVLNGQSYASAVDNLGEITYNPMDMVNSPGDVKLVLFTGGEDVTPSYYDDASPHGMCYYNEKRDKAEAQILGVARALEIRCIGICRGVQFLNVMAGGRMLHDINNHEGCRVHDMTLATGETIQVNSLHHQMCIPGKYAHVIGWATTPQATRYYGKDDELENAPELETEAMLFTGLQSAGVQYHPEMMHRDTEGWKWFNELAADLINVENFDEIIQKYTGDTKCRSLAMQSGQ